MSVAPAFTLCCAQTVVEVAFDSAIKPAKTASRASALVRNMGCLPAMQRLLGRFLLGQSSKGGPQRPMDAQPLASAATLKFRSVMLPVRHRNFKVKAALES